MIPETYKKASNILLWTLAAAFLAIAAWMAVSYLIQPDFENAVLYPAPRRVLADFELNDANDAVFDRRRLKGQWNLVFFGYTRCPDVCPTTLQAMHQAAEELRRRGAPDPQYLFISVDSKRDDVQQLGNYARYFDPAFIGLTGDAGAIERITKIFGAPFNYYTLEQNPQFEYINHPAAIYVVSPDARLYAMLPAPHSPEKIANDMGVMQNHYDS